MDATPHDYQRRVKSVRVEAKDIEIRTSIRHHRKKLNSCRSSLQRKSGKRFALSFVEGSINPRVELYQIFMTTTVSQN